PGKYVTIERVWKTGDTVRFVLPLAVRLTKYTGTEKDFKNAYALEYGPVLLAVTGATSRGIANIPLTPAEFLKKLRPVAGKPLHFTIDAPDAAPWKIIPYYEVKGPLLDSFTCFPNLTPPRAP
ncbi:MAG: glycoside hydrolase family 127 protein, partial [Puniceicoccales bacterium]|nr:glycoside hydrolase family 127 protein [Puniceicoccales bacterium]